MFGKHQKAKLGRTHGSTRYRRILRRAVVIMVAAACTTVAFSGSASADVGSGSCSNVFSATGRVDYTVSMDGHVHFNRFDWTINGQSGSTQNDVIIELKRDVSLGSDPVIYTWSTSSARNGGGSHTPPFELSTPVLWTMYGRYHFIFDRNNLPDPECYARTSNLN